MNTRRSTLWTPNFTIITLGTIISAMGGVAVNFSFSFVVFDNSQSTLLAGIFSAISMIPGILLPILISPYLDHFKRKPIIVGIDALNAFLYFAFGMFLLFSKFNFVTYMLFSLVTGCTGTIYQLAYTSFYPNLIPEGYAQKGYTVSSMIYPTVMVVMTPVASILYSNFGMGFVCMIEGVLLLVASLMEAKIKVEEKVSHAGHFSLKEYWIDLLEGVRYLKKEKGLQRIYTYMPITQGISQGNSSLIIAYFRTTPSLGVTLYSFFTIAEFIGRTLGGLVHYHVEIKAQKRFRFAFLVYQLYSFMDMILLWIGYPFMLLNRSICGFLGINSATLRESSVQNYIPDDKRAKLNAVFQATFSLSGMLFSVMIGGLGEIVSYRMAIVITAFINMLLCYFIMYRGREKVKEIYNHNY